MALFIFFFALIALTMLLANMIGKIRRKEPISTNWFTEVEAEHPLYPVAVVPIFIWTLILALIWLAVAWLVVSSIIDYLIWWWSIV